MGRKMIDLTGKKFGKLTVLRPTDKRYQGNRTVIWMCICDCGNLREVSENALMTGRVWQCKECASHKYWGKKYQRGAS